jgi:hypothetical protein
MTALVMQIRVVELIGYNGIPHLRSGGGEMERVAGAAGAENGWALTR